jgi:hypothetical protein
MAQQLRERTDKWDYLKLKSFCTMKEMVTRLKELPTEWEKKKVQVAKKKKKHMKKMLNIPGHKGNANQNHVKIPPHSC